MKNDMDYDARATLIDYFVAMTNYYKSLLLEINNDKYSPTNNIPYRWASGLSERELGLWLYSDIEGRSVYYQLKYTNMLIGAVNWHNRVLSRISRELLVYVEASKGSEPELRFKEEYDQFFLKNKGVVGTKGSYFIRYARSLSSNGFLYEKLQEEINKKYKKALNDIKNNPAHSDLAKLMYGDSKVSDPFRKNPKLSLNHQELVILGHRLASSGFISKSDVENFANKLTDDNSELNKITWASGKNPYLIALMEEITLSNKRDDKFTEEYFITAKPLTRNTRPNGANIIRKMIDTIYA